MERSRLVADRAYYVQSSGCYFYTPDAEGGYWYDTYEQLASEHGAQRVYYVEHLEDW